MNRGDVRIAQYENGSRTPKTGTLKRIAAALGVEPEDCSVKIAENVCF